MVNKNKLFKAIGSVLLVSAFLTISYGSGEDENKEEWKKNSKESFCGKEFRSSHTIDAIDMTTKVVTILNCDGTYTSKEDWGTSNQNEETYRSTVGRSSGNNGDFSGTWEIVETKPTEIDLSGYKESEYTIIKYRSNKGKERYASVCYNVRISGKLSLDPVALDSDCYEPGVYHQEDLHMYSGFAD
jgi:hypothetical protein